MFKWLLGLKRVQQFNVPKMLYTGLSKSGNNYNWLTIPYTVYTLIRYYSNWLILWTKFSSAMKDISHSMSTNNWLQKGLNIVFYLRGHSDWNRPRIPRISQGILDHLKINLISVPVYKNIIGNCIVEELPRYLRTPGCFS